MVYGRLECLKCIKKGSSRDGGLHHCRIGGWQALPTQPPAPLRPYVVWHYVRKELQERGGEGAHPATTEETTIHHNPYPSPLGPARAPQGPPKVHGGQRGNSPRDPSTHQADQAKRGPRPEFAPQSIRARRTPVGRPGRTHMGPKCRPGDSPARAGHPTTTAAPTYTPTLPDYRSTTLPIPLASF